MVVIGWPASLLEVTGRNKEKQLRFLVDVGGAPVSSFGGRGTPLSRSFGATRLALLETKGVQVVRYRYTDLRKW